MKSLLPSIFWLASALSLATASDQDLKQILSALNSDGFDLDVSKLPKAADNQHSLNSEKEFTRFIKAFKTEVYKFPPKLIAEDQFSYLIYFRPDTREFWIARYGGIAATSNFYGPGRLKEATAEQGAAANP